MAIMPFMPRGFKLKQQSRRDWASCGYMHHSDCFASTHDKNDDLEEFKKGCNLVMIITLSCVLILNLYSVLILTTL